MGEGWDVNKAVVDVPAPVKGHVCRGIPPHGLFIPIRRQGFFMPILEGSMESFVYHPKKHGKAPFLKLLTSTQVSNMSMGKEFEDLRQPRL